MDTMSQATIKKILIHLTYGDMVRVRFNTETKDVHTIELGAKVAEVTSKFLVITSKCYDADKTIAISVERIVAVEKIVIPTEEEAPATKVSFCEQPKITNRFIDTIQRNVKWPNQSGSFGKWDGLSQDIRQFLRECAEYMLSLEVVAKEGIELKQSLEKARLEREGKTLYEKSSYVYAAYFRRHSHDEPEMGFVINEDVLLDASGKIVYNVYDCQTRDDLGAMTMYVPVSKEISGAEDLKRAEQCLKELIAGIKGKYYAAQSRQYNGDRPSGRMYGLGEAIDLAETILKRIQEGD